MHKRETCAKPARKLWPLFWIDFPGQWTCCSDATGPKISSALAGIRSTGNPPVRRIQPSEGETSFTKRRARSRTGLAQVSHRLIIGLRNRGLQVRILPGVFQAPFAALKRLQRGLFRWVFGDAACRCGLLFAFECALQIARGHNDCI